MKIPPLPYIVDEKHLAIHENGTVFVFLQRLPHVELVNGIIKYFLSASFVFMEFCILQSSQQVAMIINLTIRNKHSFKS